MKLIILLFCSFGFIANVAVAAEIKSDWDQKYYNPQPAAGDLILPMPCGGAMTFRAISVPGRGWLDDQRVELGQAAPKNLAYKEGRRFEYIAGSFSDADVKGGRFYYIGKYETTRTQYDTFAAECPKPSNRDRLPAVDVSWFDAVDFARRYSEWLLQNASGQLPAEGDLTGFLRLPTEVEWEFAARGGVRVDKAQFVASLFPMDSGQLAEYVWYGSSSSADGKLHPAGLLKPNPLGLHDMLGNAAEMVFIPFHLDKRGRLHGQTGGFIAKGGDFLSSESQLRTAARDELNYFDERTRKAKTLRTLGFRLVLTAPVIVSHERLQAIQEEWDELPLYAQLGQPEGGEAQPSERALEDLAQLTQQVTNDQLRASLQQAQADLENANTRANEARDRAIKALIRMGAYLNNKLFDNNRRLRSIDIARQTALDNFAKLQEQVRGRADEQQQIERARASIEQIDQALTGQQQALAIVLSYYGDIVIEAAGDYAMALIEPQLSILEQEFEQQQSAYLIVHAGLFVRHLNEYQTTQQADTQRWLQEVLSL